MVELMVWSVLALLILTVASFFFVRMLSYTRQGLRRGEAHGNAALVMSRVTQELSQANTSGVAWREPDDSRLFALSIHPSDGATQERQPTFRDRLRLFRWNAEDQEVVRRETAPGEVAPPLQPLIPFRPNPAQLDQLCLAARPSWLLVGTHIEKFRVSNFKEDLPEGRVHGVLRVEVRAKSVEDRSFHLTSTVTLPASY